MSRSKINFIILGHANIFQKGPWKNDIHYANSYRDTIQADLPHHSDCLKSAYQNILAFLKLAEARGHSDCRRLCEEVLRRDPQNINAHLHLYDITKSKEERKKLIDSVRDILKSVSRDHHIGVALIELGVALSALIPQFYEEESVEVYDENLAELFKEFDCFNFKSDVTNIDIPWRNEIDISGIYNHETKNAYRWYNAVIYQREGLYRLSKSHVVSRSDISVYTFSLAQATNRLSHILLSSGGADYQRDHYSESSMKLFCQVIETMDHTAQAFYVSRSYAYLGLMVQKRKVIAEVSGSDLMMPECFRTLKDLETIWDQPEQAYIIAKEKFPPDIVVCTRYGKFLVNDKRYDEALEQLKLTESLSPCEKWFPNHVKMAAYYFKFISKRDEEQRNGQQMSSATKDLLENIIKYGNICKNGQSTMDSLYYFAKALFWSGTEFQPGNIWVSDEGRVKDAIDVIDMIYEEYRNQDLTKVYKLHAECTKALGNQIDPLRYMICSFNASKKDDKEVLPSFKYLCLYGLELCSYTDVDRSTKEYALRQTKHAIEDEIRYCQYLVESHERNAIPQGIKWSILEEEISGDLCREIGADESTPCKRLTTVFKEIKKMSNLYPEEVKTLLENLHTRFIFTQGTKTMKTMMLICLGGKHKEWTRYYNRKFPRAVKLSDMKDIQLFFKTSDHLFEGNKRARNEEYEYDFCVIHSPREQDWVACCLRSELEEGPERFKGCIYERDAPRERDIGDFLLRSMKSSKKIIVVLSPYFVLHTSVRLQRHLKELRKLRPRVMAVRLESIEEDEKLQWLFEDVFDASTHPVNWQKFRSRLLEDSSTYTSGTLGQQRQKSVHPRTPNTRPIGNYSSMLRSMETMSVNDDELPSYKMDARPRGIALIINNISFDAATDVGKPFGQREGAHIDQAKLIQLWKLLHFKTEVCKNLSKEDMDKKLQHLATRDHGTYDCLVVCVMSHGGPRKVYGSDGQPLDIDGFVSHFYATKCPSLAGKPKLFFIQACQGTDRHSGLTIPTDGCTHEQWQPDGPSVKPTIIHDRADILIGQSTTPGSMSARFPNQGSLYISMLVRLVQNYYKRQDLLSILTVVNQQVSEINLTDSGPGVHKQVPQPETTLTKKIYF